MIVSRRTSNQPTIFSIYARDPDEVYERIAKTPKLMAQLKPSSELLRKFQDRSWVKRLFMRSILNHSGPRYWPWFERARRLFWINIPLEDRLDEVKRAFIGSDNGHWIIQLKRLYKNQRR